MFTNERPKWSYYSSSHSSCYTSGRNTWQNGDSDCSGSNSTHYSTLLALPHHTLFLFHQLCLVPFPSFKLLVCLGNDEIVKAQWMHHFKCNIFDLGIVLMEMPRNRISSSDKKRLSKRKTETKKSELDELIKERCTRPKICAGISTWQKTSALC